MGSPRMSMLEKCREILKTAAIHRMDEPDAYTLFQYGPEIGDRKFREAVAKLLTDGYQAPVDVNDIVATAGATQGLHLLSHILFSPGDIVFVEDPTYFLATEIFQSDANLNVKAVPMDDSGIIPEELEKVIEANKNYKPRELTVRKPYWGILYVLANFQNPRGMCLPPDRCRRVIELARKHNLLVISDDVYNLIYHEKPPVTLFSYDKKSDPDYVGTAISNGSFSKIFGPGMRLGWLEAPQKVRNIILSTGLAASGGSFNHTAAGIMASVIELGLLDNLLKEARPMYREQCHALCSTLKAEVPSLELIQPSGGYFVWIKLPGGLNGKELLDLCKKKYDIAFCPGELTSVDGHFKDYIRLSFSHYDKETLTDSARRLSQAIKDLMQNKLPKL